MNGANAAVLDLPTVPYNPIIEIATSYKNASRQALLFEYTVGTGALLVCTLNLTSDDPAAAWLRSEILRYAASDDFTPEIRLTEAQLAQILSLEAPPTAGNDNAAMNKNDITAN